MDYLHLYQTNGHQTLQGVENMWSCDFTWWIKNIESAQSQWLWSPKNSTYRSACPLNHVVLGHVTNWIHFISTYESHMGSKIGRLLTYYKRLPPLKSHNTLITWPTWVQVTDWKKYISTLTRFMASNFDRLLTLERIFRTQMLKVSPASCTFFSFFYCTVFLDRLAKFVYFPSIVALGMRDQYWTY